jgi:hypothetical protein
MDLLDRWKTLAKIENARMLEPYEGQKPNYGIVKIRSKAADRGSRKLTAHSPHKNFWKCPKKVILWKKYWRKQTTQ